jgi:hypothetical protein
VLPSTGVWLTFTFAEGRSVRLLYSGGPEHGGTPFALYEPIGGEHYLVSPRVGAAIDSVLPRVLEIEQQSGRGSPVWWVVMLGGGLACLAAALWLRRRLQPAAR